MCTPLLVVLGMALAAEPVGRSEFGPSPRWNGLPDLEARFRRMHRSQTEVLRGCEALWRELDSRKDGKATREQSAACLRLADRQDRVQWDVVIILARLRSEASAIAFVEVVEQLVRDMEKVRRALAEAAPDRATLAVARDVVETLEESVRALRMR
jgi:hypothetical protein